MEGRSSELPVNDFEKENVRDRADSQFLRATERLIWSLTYLCLFLGLNLVMSV